jgi:bifunctional DNA-binding transcriptional regulator/antitoxin component of YhaV-PrlF toxin-antitoxin module
MEEVTLKVDAKGRLCIPAEIREQIGDAATSKKTRRLPDYPRQKSGFLGRI